MRIKSHRAKSIKPPSGFTLVELMVVISIIALILVMGVPSFQTFLQNRQIRNTAESIASGMQKARAEAVKSNSNHEFQINVAAGTWGIYQLAGTPLTRTLVEQFDFKQRWRNTTIAITPNGNNTVTFDGVGRLQANNNIAIAMTPVPLSADPFTAININGVLTTTNIYPMTVQAGARGIRTCLPHLPATDPKGC